MEMLSPLIHFSYRCTRVTVTIDGDYCKGDWIHCFTDIIQLLEEYIVATINVNLISGRSIQQGVAIEGGKEKPCLSHRLRDHRDWIHQI